jgi:hypothetical protein
MAEIPKGQAIAIRQRPIADVASDRVGWLGVPKTGSRLADFVMISGSASQIASLALVRQRRSDALRSINDVTEVDFISFSSHRRALAVHTMHYTEALLLATISIVKFCSYPMNFVTSHFCSREL